MLTDLCITGKIIEGMKERITTYLILLASVFVLMLTGCVNDDTDVRGEKLILNLVPYISSFDDANQSANVKTRAVVYSGYSKYSVAYPNPAAGYGKIKLYLANQDNENNWVLGSEGEFTYKGNDTWQSTVYVEPSMQYNVYGYMPSGCANCSASFTSTGATLTLSGLNAISPEDVCVVVGLDRPGQFEYLAHDTDNKINLLLNHIYSQVSFKFAVDESYYNLRTIRLKKVVMESPSTTSTMTATVTLTNNATSPMTCTFAAGGGSSVNTQELFAGEKDLTTEYQEVQGFFAPGADPLSFNVTCTYDVLDKSGNCVREGCTAKNKITIEAAVAGDNNTVKMLVQPTYLYSLSQPDADNPTIKVVQ